MDPNSFDLEAFVAEQVPAMLNAEADDATWRAGYGDGRDVRRPVTALVADDSPLTAFLRSEPVHPEGATRAEQADFYAARDAAREQALQAAQDAARDHARWLEGQQLRRTADSLDTLMARAVAAQDEREKGTTAIPVKGADQSAIGRW